MDSYIAFPLIHIIISLIVLSTPAAPLVSGDWCHSNLDHHCNCTTSGLQMIVDCSNQNIKSCNLQIPSNVTDLNIADNQISNFTKQCIFRNISTLNVSNNRIDSLNRFMFNHSGYVTVLDLSGNYLNYSNMNNVDMFIGLRMLKRLYIDSQHSFPPSSQLMYPDTALGVLTTLQELRIDGVPNGTFGVGFRNMVTLTNLTLASVSDTVLSHCNINSLMNHTFENVTAIEFLNMSGCNVLTIDVGTFMPLRQIITLDLSNNINMHFKSLPNITYGLQNSTIEKLFINRIHETFGIGTVFRNYDIRFLKNVKLKEMYLDFNRIELVESCAISNLPTTLEVMSTNGNRHTFGHYLCEFNDAPSLKILYANQLYISQRPRILEHVDFECEHEHVEKTILPNHHRKVIRTTSECDIMHKDLICSRGNFSIPTTLEELYVRDSTLFYEIRRINIQKNNTLKKVDISGNHLYKWTGTLNNVDNLEYFDLSDNHCESVHDDFFTTFTSLQTLLINNNLLGFTIHSNKGLFDGLKHLNILRFASNRVQMLPENIFKDLDNLEILDLSSNILAKFDVNVGHMKRLKMLDLAHNQLQTIPDSTRNGLLQLSKNITFKLTIDLTNNYFQCICSNLEFLKWMMNPTLKFLHVENYICIDDQGRSTTLDNLQGTVLELQKKCANYTLLITLTSVGITIALTVIVAFILNRYKWKLRYLLYKNWNRHRRYGPIDEAPREHFRYDAFISYADGDVRFVRDRLIEGLEEKFDLRLCIHHRDFLAGNAVAANIMDAITSSYRTVIIMSARFLRSDWCMYELNMARMESIYSRDGQNVVFVVMLEQVNTSRLPLEVLELIQNQSYLEYPNDPDQGDVVFWSKLRDVIER